MRDNEGLRRAGALLVLAVMIAVVIALRPGSGAQPLDPKAVSRPAAPSNPLLSATGETRADMAAAGRAAAGLPRLHSLLVSWRGELILEHSGNGGRGSRPANVKSVSKSIISTLVGIAIDRGHIKSVHQPIADYFPELRRASDPRKQKITIEHLLTMRSGLESTSGGGYGPWVRSRNWVRYALERPLVGDPGTDMEYSTGSTHLLSAILTKSTRMSTWQFAQTALMRPLGITLAKWTRDPQGIFLGGNEMLLTPRQMAAFGELYLNDGRHKGRQIVPSGWVEASCEPRTSSRWNSDRRYGYGWWMRELGGVRTCFAWGYGGQYIFVFRDLDLVVVTTSSTSADEERRGYRRTLFDLIERDVIRPVAAAAAAARP